MKLGLLVLCGAQSATEAAFLLPERGWELTHLAEDKPAPCTGLGSSRSFSSSRLKVKELGQSLFCHMQVHHPMWRDPIPPWAVGVGCALCLSWALPSTDMLEEAPTGLAVLFSLMALRNPGSRLWLSGFLCPHSWDCTAAEDTHFSPA